MGATDKENDKEFLDDDSKWEFNEAVTEVFDEMLGAGKNSSTTNVIAERIPVKQGL